MISVVLVSKQRNEFVIKDFQEEKSNLNSSQKQNNKFIQNSSERLLKIFISRLIGVEGVMAVSSSDKLSFNLFFSAFHVPPYWYFCSFCFSGRHNLHKKTQDLSFS